MQYRVGVLLLLWGLFFPLIALAVPLTESQYAVLAASINGNPALTSFISAHDDQAIADYMNADDPGPFWVWRTSVSKDELKFLASQDGTTFTFAGNGFITRTVQELIGWQELFNTSGLTNPSLPKVRDGFADVFSGTGNAAANRTHLLASARRKATRAERLYATGTGGTAPADVGLLVWEGVLSARNVAHALRGVPLSE